MLDRHSSRILALQALCQLEVLGDDFLSQLDEFLADESPPPGVKDYAADLTRETWSHRDEVDAAIQSASENWKVPRMAPVDRNILRLAVCELYYHADIGARVTIDEAIEIAKQFGAAESPAFINGILDAVWSSKARAAKRRRKTAKTD
jgi:N utilization substance protein B